MTTTDERKRAASSDLLDPETYAEQGLDRLQAERATINNRLSGLGTQIKRHGAAGHADKVAVAEGRRDELLDRRNLLAEAIKAKASAAPTNAARPAAATPRRSSSRKTGTAKKASAAKKKTTAARKTGAKKTTTRKTTARRR